jgi:hypothetical protein
LQRPRYQFRLWQLFWLTGVIAATLALCRLDIVDAGRIVFVCGELSVVIFGTIAFVDAGRNPSYPAALIRGAISGAGLAGVCFGWLMVIAFFIQPGSRPIIGLGTIVGLGSLVGLSLGSVVTWWKRSNQQLHQSFDDLLANYRLTDRTRQILLLASGVAQLEGKSHMQPVHILIGIVLEGTGVGACVIKSLGVELSNVPAALCCLPCDSNWKRARCKRRPDKQTVALIARGKAEARRLKHDFVGSEHLLLAFADKKSGCSQELGKLGLTAEQVRSGVLRVLGVAK